MIRQAQPAKAPEARKSYCHPDRNTMAIKMCAGSVVMATLPDGTKIEIKVAWIHAGIVGVLIRGEGMVWEGAEGH